MQPESITPRKLKLRELLVKNDTFDNPFNFSASFGDMKQYFAKFGDSKDSDEQMALNSPEQYFSEEEND